MCTIEWQFERSQRRIPVTPKGSSVPTKQSPPFPAPSLATTYQLSASVDWPSPGIS